MENQGRGGRGGEYVGGCYDTVLVVYILNSAQSRQIMVSSMLPFISLIFLCVVFPSFRVIHPPHRHVLLSAGRDSFSWFICNLSNPPPTDRDDRDETKSVVAWLLLATYKTSDCG